MADAIEITVNGTRHRVVAAADTPLLYVLRDEIGLNAPKFGCGLAQCGACTVHLGERAHPLQQAFIAEQAAQCGYCISGMIMTAAALLRQTPRPSESEIRSALD